MSFTLIILSNKSLKKELIALSEKKDYISDIFFSENLTELEACVEQADGDAVLVAFGTGVIVSKNLIEKIGLEKSFNIHPGSRFFPGRDPHHFAAYEEVKEFGATAHYMTAKVDDGMIVAESLIPVSQNLKPIELKRIAEFEGKKLFKHLLDQISMKLIKPIGLSWEGRKRTRKDFLDLSEICITMSSEEIKKRKHAVEFPGFNNTRIMIDEESYLLIPEKTKQKKKHEPWQYFTEKGYSDLIELTLNNGFQFEPFNTATKEKHVLWRHDVDGSMLRAKKIGEIEGGFGVKSTFFIHLRSTTYNPLDKINLNIMKFLADKGHDLGLHFDAGYYGYDLSQSKLESLIDIEKTILEHSINLPLKAVSFHDPEAGDMLQYKSKLISGLINAYSEDLREKYEYCSDSNGYWRHKSIPEVIKNGGHQKIQVLTHPMWWTQKPLPPRKRVTQMLLNNAKNIIEDYDAHLEAAGRKNIKN